MPRIWTAADLSPRLAGELVTVEPLRAGHEGALFAAARPGAIWRWWPFNPAVDRDSFHRWMSEVLAEVEEGRTARFAILDADGRPIGATSFCDLRPADRAVEIGWTWLTPGAWRTGANAEAKLLLLRHAFGALGCRRVEFYTDELNARSRGALAALPAHFEGVLRDVKLLPDGRWRSSAVYSVLVDEWPVVERALASRVANRVT
jgi:RimJ/RimL family protein N-acetyltransferase